MTTVVTHSGSFHADDVFAVATLLLALDDIDVQVVRSRSQEVIDAAEWVIDVGGIYDPAAQRFDHHQPGAPVRDNGVPYAAFGLVWKHFGEVLCGSLHVAQAIEQKLVLPIDAGDTGVSLYQLNQLSIAPYELYQVVKSFAPAWGSGGSKDMAFIEAVEWAKGLLQRSIAQQRAIQTMDEIVAQTYEQSEDKRLLMFDVPVSALAAIQFPEVEVVICPDDPDSNSNWTATTVRKTLESFESRVQFPESWAGLREEELAEVSGIQDAIFCHKARFLFVAGSKESTVAAARMVV